MKRGARHGSFALLAMLAMSGCMASIGRQAGELLR